MTSTWDGRTSDMLQVPLGQTITGFILVRGWVVGWECVRGESSCEGPGKGPSREGGDGVDKRQNLVEEDLAVGESGDRMKCISSPARRFSNTSSTSSEASLLFLEVSLLLKFSSEHDFDTLTLPADELELVSDFSVTELLELTGNAMFWVKSFTLLSKAMMFIKGYLSLNQCRKIDDFGTKVDCLAHQLLN